MNSNLTVNLHGDSYLVSYYPGSSGTYYDPPEAPELEILQVNGKDFGDVSMSDEEYDELTNELITCVLNQLDAEEEDRYNSRKDLDDEGGR